MTLTLISYGESRGPLPSDSLALVTVRICSSLRTMLSAMEDEGDMTSIELSTDLEEDKEALLLIVFCGPTIPRAYSFLEFSRDYDWRI
jgi:hypothetical protein